MQDRITRIDKNLLHRTAGPYIRVKSTYYRIAMATAASPQSTDIQSLYILRQASSLTVVSKSSNAQ